MSAGHSLRRQNYSFMTITPPTAPHTSGARQFMRFIILVVSALALNLATFMSISMLLTGR